MLSAPPPSPVDAAAYRQEALRAPACDGPAIRPGDQCLARHGQAASLSVLAWTNSRPWRRGCAATHTTGRASSSISTSVTRQVQPNRPPHQRPSRQATQRPRRRLGIRASGDRRPLTPDLLGNFPDEASVLLIAVSRQRLASRSIAYRQRRQFPLPILTPGRCGGSASSTSAQSPIHPRTMGRPSASSRSPVRMGLCQGLRNMGSEGATTYRSGPLATISVARMAA